MPTDSPLILGRAVPAAGAKPSLDHRAEALFAQARKRHEDEIRADERKRWAKRCEELALEFEPDDDAATSPKADILRELADELRGKP